METRKAKMQFEKLCTKFFVVSLKCLTILSQWLLLLPVIYDKIMQKFKSQRYCTVAAMFKCSILALVAPTLLVNTLKIYPVSEKDIDAYIIVMGSMICDVTLSLLLFAAQIWQRQHIKYILNHFLLLLRDFEKESNQSWVRWEIVTLFLMKLVLTLYEIFVDLPFLLHTQWTQLINGLIINYILALGAIISFIHFVAILLTISWLEYMETRLHHMYDTITTNEKTTQQIEREMFAQQLERWISYECIIRKITTYFNEKFQFTIFVLLFRYFLNLLVNMYGFLYVYVKTQKWVENNVIYCLKFAAELYGLIFIAHWCSDCHRRVKALLLSIMLKLEFIKNENTEQDYFHKSALWLYDIEFDIFGIFVLRNEFWLTLIVYATNFIVVITQFAYIEIQQMK